jgi:hypothetical protein
VTLPEIGRFAVGWGQKDKQAKGVLCAVARDWSRLARQTAASYHPRRMDAPFFSTTGAPQAGFWSRMGWNALLLLLTAAQAWMTLGLFDAGRDWHRILDDEPILSGRHPLHMYHGHLGALSFLSRRSLCCYDPAFQAGYPKTPVFDAGSRPAEFFLSLSGAGYRPAAYKLGLASFCCLVPLLVACAAWGVGLGPGARCLASVLAVLVCWSDPCRALLVDGDLDLLIAGLAALLHAALLVRLDRQPGLTAWVGLLASSAVGWFAQPLLFGVLAIPLLLIYYLTAGVRHGPFWHATFLAALAGGMAANSFWLVDWFNYWWVLNPVPTTNTTLARLTFQAIWLTPLWGESIDRALAIALFGLGVVGLAIFNQNKGRASARLLGLGGGGLLVLALAGLSWEPLERLGTSRLLVPALWFATLPTTCTAAWCFGLLRWLTGATWRAAALVIVLLAVGGVAGASFLHPVVDLCKHMETLDIGLGNERQAIVDTIAAATSADARILYEEPVSPGSGAHWTALLPLLTGRAYLGGLDPDASAEFGHIALSAGSLAGRPIATWTDPELELFCRRYNLGWVVCWSPETLARFRKWKLAEPVAELGDAERGGCLFALRRPRSFILKGQARWLMADSQRIVLGDVVPDGDEVVLSLHYQSGLMAMPARAKIEPIPDPDDPIPLVRVRLSSPVSRLMLIWQEP